MTLLATDTPAQNSTSDLLEALAAQQVAENLKALSAIQPWATQQLPSDLPGWRWARARDGSLTARAIESGDWWAGCSVPRRAAAMMLKGVELHGTCACLLAPPHAGVVRAALEKLEPQQAIIAIVPDALSAWLILCCEDFADDLRAHRLWFAIGADWEQQLDRLLSVHGGLPIPTRFIRLDDGSDTAPDALIAPAQRVFSIETSRRAGRIAAIRSRPRGAYSKVERLCVVAPSHFRLWGDAGPTLLAAVREMAGVEVRWFDPDMPSTASPLAIAELAADCDAILTANTTRAELPNVLPDGIPWVSWHTTPARLPRRDQCGLRDRLVLADPAWQSLALSAGWNALNISCATWPTTVHTVPAHSSGVGLIADTSPLTPPPDIADLSSHRLLWEAIADELVRDPFALGNDILGYLSARRARLGIPDHTLNTARFIDGVIVPAYQQGIARIMRAAGLPLRLFGKGWDTTNYEALPLLTRQAFSEAIAGCAVLIHALPLAGSHPIDACGHPVVRSWGMTREQFLRQVTAALSAGPRQTETPARNVPPLSPAFLARLLAAAMA